MAVSRPLLGPRRSVLLAIVGVVFYTLLVGAGASVVPAAIMSSPSLIAGPVGRRAWGLNTLAAAAIWFAFPGCFSLHLVARLGFLIPTLLTLSATA